MSKEEDFKNEYIRLTKKFIEEVREKIDEVVDASVKSRNAETLDVAVQSFENNINRFEQRVDALVEILAHIMAQNEMISELLVYKGIMNNNDISNIKRKTNKKVRELMDYINESIGRNKNKPKIKNTRHPELIKLLQKIEQEHVKDNDSKSDTEN